MNARRWLVMAVIGCLAGLVGPGVWGQDRSTETRIAELEKRIRDLESEKKIAQPNAFLGAPVAAIAGDPQPEAQPFIANAETAPGSFISGLSAPSFGGFSDGFVLKSADDKDHLRFTGQIQADSRTYPRQGDFTDNDTFLIRRARLGIEANVFDYYEFRFLPDFGNGKSVIQDAFMNVHYWDQLQFQVGKFKEPVSYEQLIQDRFVPTLERSLIDQIAPARDVGVMVHGEKVLADQFEYAVGAFNGEINSDADTNKIKDFAALIAWRPFNYAGLPEFVRPFEIGVSGTAGKEQEALSLNGTNILRTPGNVPWLTFNNLVRADGIRTRVTPEVSYVYNSLGFAAQYMRMDQEMRSGVPTVTTNKTGKPSIIDDPVQDIRFEGYYFLGTYLLTGEKRTTYSEAVKPLRPFDPLHPILKPGAWELVARVAHLQVDPSIFRPDPLHNLAKANGNSDAATELTVGFNWYLNALVRMQFNWEHSWFQQPLLLGPNNAYFRQLDAVLVRFQIIF